MSKTVWSNADRTRHFLIPDDADLPSGDFVLRTVIGRQMEVDEAAAVPYEVSQEEARAHLKEQLGAVMDEAKTKLTGFVEHLRARTAELRAEREQAVGDFLDQMRTAAEQTSSEDVGARGDAIESALHDLSDLITDLGHALRSIGETAKDPLAQADRLEALAGDIEQAAATAGSHLRKQAAKLRAQREQEGDQQGPG